VSRQGRPERSEFHGFESLRDSLGLPPLEEPEERGWSLERKLPAEAPLPPRDETAARNLRVRVDARPYAFGEMQHGPAAYRDAESEELSVLWGFRVRTSWPRDVQDELGSLSAEDVPAREDLRALPICTIDGADAKDFDDAISFRTLEGGRCELGVHIADVSAWVRPGSALDAEALARATSIYLPEHVVPMLPERLSNELCSLVPHEDRLCFSVFCTFDARGQRLESRFTRSIIHSKARLTYAEVQRFFDVRKTAERERLIPSELHAPLDGLRRWTEQQQRLRDARGSLRIQSEERRIVFDREGRPSHYAKDPRYFAHALIEETALAANQAVGSFLRSAGVPSLYRHHPEKDPDEVAAIAQQLAEHDIHVPDPAHLTGRDIGALVRIARSRPNADALIPRIMGLLERAEYRAFASDDEARHFGLARRSYLHFTSPIRRYPDLVTHRLLAHALDRQAGSGGQAGSGPERQQSPDELCEIASHCTLRSSLAEQAERAIEDLLVCEMLQPQIGKRLRARILRVSRYGLELRLDANGADIHIPIRELGRIHSLEGPTLRTLRGNALRSFVEGQRLDVTVQAVDFRRLQVLATA
jgi:ribonuclease R